MREHTNHSPAKLTMGREAEFKAALDAYVASYRAQARRLESADIPPASRFAVWLAGLWLHRTSAFNQRRMA